MKKLLFLLCASLAFCSCSKNKEQVSSNPVLIDPNIVKFNFVYDSMSSRFKSEVKFNQEDILSFVNELENVIAEDSDDLLMLVDKNNLVSSDYVPYDLIDVKNCNSYVVNRNDLSLRKSAFDNLDVLCRAAKKDGILMAISSTYRSYSYQDKLYKRNVLQLGKEVADRESAFPGSSQHQLGVAVDFGSVTDDFEYTAQGKWLKENATKYGWSLSFPQGYEDVTGFRYECWHYRFIGVKPCLLQEKYFNNVQQFMIEFVNAWKKL